MYHVLLRQCPDGIIFEQFEHRPICLYPNVKTAIEDTPTIFWWNTSSDKEKHEFEVESEVLYVGWYRGE